MWITKRNQPKNRPAWLLRMAAAIAAAVILCSAPAVDASQAAKKPAAPGVLDCLRDRIRWYGKKADAEQEQAVVDELANVPAFILARLLNQGYEIELVNREKYELDEEHDVIGRVFNNEDVHLIQVYDTPDAMRMSLLHEVGHVVFKDFDVEYMDEYRKIGDDKKQFVQDMNNAYYEDDEEYFCELFQYTLHEKNDGVYTYGDEADMAALIDSIASHFPSASALDLIEWMKNK